jgi:hypothetical protein
VGAAQYIAADGLGVGQATRPHQADGLFGQQPIPHRVGWVGEFQGPLQQVHGDRGRARRGHTGGSLQPVHGLAVARGRAARPLLGDPLGRRTSRSERAAGVQV